MEEGGGGGPGLKVIKPRGRKEKVRRRLLDVSVLCVHVNETGLKYWK